MSKGKLNKFLAIYFGALGVGVLGLGYLAWSASSGADEAEKNYKDKVAELDRLDKAPLSRTKENADKKKKLVEDYVQQVQELNASLLAYQTPVNATESSESFQKKLKEATDATRSNAKDKQVKLDDKFDLGMGKYLSEFPVAGTAARLSAQLDAIVYLANAAMEAGVSQIDSLTRAESAFETEAAETPKSDEKKKPAAKPAPKPAATAAKAPAGQGQTVDESKVLERQSLGLTVTGKNRSILALLETLANASPDKMAPHFFVVRTLRIENEKKDGPAKTVQVTADEVQPDPNNKESVYVRDAMYLLGNEQVKMHLDLDVIRFVPEAVPAEKEKSPAKSTAAATSVK